MRDEAADTTTSAVREVVHTALFYRSEREYLDSLVPLISGWLSKAEPVLVAVPENKIALLEDAFGAPPGDVTVNLTMTDITEAGRNPGGACRLAFWHCDGHLVCQARHVGYLGDLLAGCRPPTAGSGPYELFVVNAVANLVRTHTSPDGTTIHAYLRLDRLSGGDVA